MISAEFREEIVSCEDCQRLFEKVPARGDLRIISIMSFNEEDDLDFEVATAPEIQ